MVCGLDDLDKELGKDFLDDSQTGMVHPITYKSAIFACEKDSKKAWKHRPQDCQGGLALTSLSPSIAKKA